VAEADEGIDLDMGHCAGFEAGDPTLLAVEAVGEGDLGEAGGVAGVTQAAAEIGHSKGWQGSVLRGAEEIQAHAQHTRNTLHDAEAGIFGPALL
jgi:hypothetical protein